MRASLQLTATSCLPVSPPVLCQPARARLAHASSSVVRNCLRSCQKHACGQSDIHEAGRRHLMHSTGALYRCCRCALRGCPRCAGGDAALPGPAAESAASAAHAGNHRRAVPALAGGAHAGAALHLADALAGHRMFAAVHPHLRMTRVQLMRCMQPSCRLLACKSALVPMWLSTHGLRAGTRWRLG